MKHTGIPYAGLIDGIAADKVLSQSIHKLKMETKFEGRHSGTSWYDWSYQFQLKMTLVHLWSLFEGTVTPPTSGNATHEAEFRQLSLMAFAVLNVSVTEQIQQAIRNYRDKDEPAEKAWEYMLKTFEAKDSTNRILLADQLTRFRQKPNEDLEVYINRLRALQSQLGGVNTPLTEDSFCIYLVKGLTSDWEYLKQYFTLQPSLTEESVIHALTTAQRSKNAELARRGGNRNFQALLAQTGPPVKPKPRWPRTGKYPGRKPDQRRRAPGTSDPSLLVCYNCKQTGHPWSKCPSKKAGYEPTETDKQAASAIRRLKLQQKGHTGSYVTPKERPAITGQKALVAQVHQCHLSPIGRREKGVWLLDSGCSIHMTFDRTAFRKLKPLEREVDILVGNNVFITAEGQGDIPLDTPQGPILLKDVLLVPELSSNLVSYTRLMQRGCTIISTPTGVMVLEESGKLLLTDDEKGGMLYIRAKQRKHKNRKVATEGRLKHIVREWTERK